MHTDPHDQSETNESGSTRDHDHDHGHHHHDVSEPAVAVLTISSSRSISDDPSGDAIESALHAADHRVIEREVVGDERETIRSRIDAYADERVDAVVTTGGTGVTPDDVTIEAVSSLFTKELPGFGELFRRLSYDEIGTRIVGTRATAGVVDGVPVFCLPGSENAVRLGVSEIIVHELPHLVGLAQRS